MSDVTTPPAGSPPIDAATQAALDTLADLRSDADMFADVEPDEMNAIVIAMEDVRLEPLIATYRKFPGELFAIFARFERVRGYGTRISRLKSLVKAEAIRRSKTEMLSRADDLINNRPLVTTCLVAPPAGLPPKMRVPVGYSMNESGIYTLVPNSDGNITPTRIASLPMLISSIARDVTNAAVTFQITWPRKDGRWVKQIVPRATALDSRGWHDMADAGAPISSVNALDIVRWLVDFEAENRDIMPERMTSSHMGWHFTEDDDTISFLLPEGTYGTADLILSPPQGFGIIVDGWSTKGTWEEWVKHMNTLRDFPLAFLALYAAVAALLPGFLHRPGFIIDFSGVTSVGKTSVLRLGASAFGRPSEDAGGIIYSWDDTKVSIARKSCFIHSMPVILDESKRAHSPEAVGHTIFDFCHGLDRGRGDKASGSLQATMSWRTVMLSSGEAALTSFTNDGGTTARVLCFRGRPLGSNVSVGRRVATNILRWTSQHYGHFGRKVIAYLIANASKRAEFNQYIDQRADAYAKLHDSAVGGRSSMSVAMLSMAMEITHMITGIPSLDINPMEFAIDAITKAVVDSDPALRALDSIISWCNAVEEHFIGRGDREPSQGWAGFWDVDTVNSQSGKTTQWPYIAVERKALQSTLERMGYKIDEVVPAWLERNFITSVMHRGNPTPYINTSLSRTGAKRMTCVRIRRDVVDIMQNTPNDEPTTVNSVSNDE